ncbi:Subunit of heteropentameric Replication factor C (RF-C) [Cladophialophora chaetospira]|uniref:Subunit of heteropentameric Replication factor C (RF-C) n=1 Tax=Cladophialophora chaetospira TaxID=386627 RepID=A0AA38XL36_9EURO|nr:Subunit of heteropentameric Replication factor C (RF-C) [Cladophialophora chaetospira]
MADFFSNKARAAAASNSKSAAVSKPSETAERAVPWVEKYRPKSLDEVKSQEHATETLRRMVNASNLPHLLCYGPPGNGKTSTILALCRELFGPELMKSRVLELNASDERGLSVIRERVKSFAALHLTNSSNEYREKYPCPNFKIVILDEADQLTQDAQGALRRVMEIYSATTRFALCCNYVSRIIDPIASRCSKFRFKAIGGDQATARIAEILKAEHVNYEDGVIERTLKVSDGDLRRAINLLQSAARLAGASAPVPNDRLNGHGKKNVIPDDSDEEMEDVDAKPKSAALSNKIRISDIDEIAGTFPPVLTDNLIKILQKGNTRNYNNIANAINNVVASGYAANEVLSALYAKIITGDEGDLVLAKSGDAGAALRKKSVLTNVFSEYDKRLIDGVDEQLALLDMSCQIAGVLAA